MKGAKKAWRLCVVQFLYLSVFAISLSALACGQSESDPWLILTNGKKGSINAYTTRGDLVRLYGAENVVDQDIDIGEGETKPGTIIFAQDPQRSIEILWKDPDKKIFPISAQIQGDSSRWKAVHHISLGTSLKQLEQLNGRPFLLAGFDWDYSGTVTSWGKGSLDSELEGEHGRVVIRLSTPRNEAREKERSQVLGDGDFSSSNSAMQSLNPTAYQIIWIFPSAPKR